MVSDDCQLCIGTSSVAIKRESIATPPMLALSDVALLASAASDRTRVHANSAENDAMAAPHTVVDESE